MEDKDNKMRERFSLKALELVEEHIFDVRATRAEDYYMTITESKRHTKEDGSFYYQKHKIYLYKEDFDSFIESLKEVSDFIIKEKGREVITLDSTEKSDLENSSVEEDKVDDKEEVGDKESDDNSENESSDLKFEDI